MNQICIDVQKYSSVGKKIPHYNSVFQDFLFRLFSSSRISDARS